MSLRPHPVGPVPGETARIARGAAPASGRTVPLAVGGFAAGFSAMYASVPTSERTGTRTHEGRPARRKVALQLGAGLPGPLTARKRLNHTPPFQRWSAHRMCR